MGQIYTCEYCGKVLGIEERFNFIGDGIIKTQNSKKDGKCKHLEVEETEKFFLFNLVKEKIFYFPETQTQSSQLEYLGPKNLFILWICMIILKTDKILVQKRWIFRRKCNFYGNGLKFF